MGLSLWEAVFGKNLTHILIHLSQFSGKSNTEDACRKRLYPLPPVAEASAHVWGVGSNLLIATAALFYESFGRASILEKAFSKPMVEL